MSGHDPAPSLVDVGVDVVGGGDAVAVHVAVNVNVSGPGSRTVTTHMAG
jgi:hypothetical protein